MIPPVKLTRSESVRILENLMDISLQKWEIRSDEEKLPNEPEYTNPAYKGGPTSVNTEFKATKRYSARLDSDIEAVVKKRTQRTFHIHSYYGYVEKVYDDVNHSLVLSQGKNSFIADEDSASRLYEHLERKAKGLSKETKRDSLVRKLIAEL